MDWPSIVGTLSGVGVLCGYLIRRVENMGKISMSSLERHTEKGEKALKEICTSMLTVREHELITRNERLERKLEVSEDINEFREYVDKQFQDLNQLIRNGGRTREGDG